MINAWWIQLGDRVDPSDETRERLARREYVYIAYIVRRAIDCIERGALVDPNDFEDAGFCRHLSLDDEFVVVTGDGYTFRNSSPLDLPKGPIGVIYFRTLLMAPEPAVKRTVALSTDRISSSLHVKPSATRTQTTDFSSPRDGCLCVQRMATRPGAFLYSYSRRVGRSVLEVLPRRELRSLSRQGVEVFSRSLRYRNKTGS